MDASVYDEISELRERKRVKVKHDRFSADAANSRVIYRQSRCSVKPNVLRTMIFFNIIRRAARLQVAIQHNPTLLYGNSHAGSNNMRHGGFYYLNRQI